MPDVTIEDNTGEAKKAMEMAVLRALEIIGGMAEGYAKGLTPVKTGALRNSITHKVDKAGKTVTVGSNVHYAPYVELGTGNQYEPPPEWIEAQAKRGRGLSKWYYKDDKGKWHVGYPRKGVKMIQRAIKEHMEEYKNVIVTELTEAGGTDVTVSGG